MTRLQKIKEKETIGMANYIIATKSTIRQTAYYFGVSKSTVHKRVKSKLPEISCSLSQKVEKILKFNKSQRHIRGGQSTKEKYEKAKIQKREVTIIC